MIEELRIFFRPTIPKIVYAMAILAWEYFYIFQSYDFGFVNVIKSYIDTGLGAVHWGSFFVRNMSLFVIWITVAILIYVSFLGTEVVGNMIHNIKIKMTYANQDSGEYNHLLRHNTISFRTHFVPHLLWTGGLLLLFLGFFFLAPLVEKFRLASYDRFFWQMVEGGVALEYDNLTYTVVSFIATLPFWYFYSALIFFIFREGKLEENEADITEEHYTAVIEGGS